MSDGLYGPTEHYVSRQRLTAMLEHEYAELAARLSAARGERTAFFAFTGECESVDSAPRRLYPCSRA